MRVISFERVRELPPELWDPGIPDDFFFRRSFLAAMEDGAVEDASYRYLVLLEEGGTGQPAVAGVAVLSAFTLKLDLLSGERLIRGLRRISGRMLDVPIVCCGIPASFGQHHLHVRAEGSTGPAVRVVHRSMEAWAEERGARFLFWKEWSPTQPAYDAIRAEGFVALPTLPDHRVHVDRILHHSPIVPGSFRTRNWTAVCAFLRTLRAPYRRKFRAAEALLRGPGPEWHDGPFRLREAPFTSEDVRTFHDGYQQVLKRTRVRLETYPVEFFHALAGCGLDVTLLHLSHRDEDEPVSALVVADREVLTFILTAKVRDRHRAPLYPLLLQCIVLLGVERGFSEVRLGQTSSYAKGSVGGRPWRLETFVRATCPWRDKGLELLGPRFFPEVQVPRLNVFHREIRQADGHPLHDAVRLPGGPPASTLPTGIPS